MLPIGDRYTMARVKRHMRSGWGVKHVIPMHYATPF